MKRKITSYLIAGLLTGIGYANEMNTQNLYLVQYSPGSIDNQLIKSFKIIGRSGNSNIAQAVLSDSEVTLLESFSGVVIERNYGLSLNTSSLEYLDTSENGIDLLQYSELEPYWLRTTGINKLPNVSDSVPVCVIDSGVDEQHIDLPQNMRGYHSQYAGFWNSDALSHGTHMAGIIAAQENGWGVKGALSDGAVNLHISKLIRTANGKNSTIWGSNLIESIEVCANSGAKVINMSLSGTKYSSMTMNVIDRLTYDRGIIFVGAAGNHGTAEKKQSGIYNDPLHYPASYHNVISVGALNTNGQAASFSPTHNKIDFVMPGTKIVSTANRHYSVVQKVKAKSIAGYEVEVPFSQIDTGTLMPQSVIPLVTSCLFTLSKEDITELTKFRRLPNDTHKALFATERQCQEDAGKVLLVKYPNTNSGYLYGLDYLTDFPTLLVHKWPFDESANVELQIKSYQSSYLVGAGTSQATAIMTGGIAKLWSQNQQWTRDQIINALKYASYDLGAAGKDGMYGHGLPDFAKALEYLNAGSISQCPSEWYYNKAYDGGENITYLGTIYRANYWSKGSNPTASSNNWRVTGLCDDSVSNPSHVNNDAVHLMNLTGLEAGEVEYECKGLSLGCGS
ncbi:S8 family serine peptidase [Pseudoalteromonas sp. MMG005]|uniref:S8 family peptidase n=1 Tax=Pseudoalteromonas sp. MMG005 TaxID=2822682 RepID=UPI001B3A2F57|nr:S8 family serine peptidase [Pseudoalteromonas sp. MMG005]MBQ4847904.1 S8 family serine peptidase [Pseudoalteromonas sp. MMG005]